MKDDLWVISPWPGDSAEEGYGPPNNHFLRKALSRSGLTFRWLEFPHMPYRTWRDSWRWWRWQTTIHHALRARDSLPRALLCLSPFPYPAVYRFARERGLRLLLKTYGFVYFSRGWLYRWRQWPLFWAFRHPPDGWIAVQDGTGGAAVVHRFSPTRIPVLEVWNARPLVMPTPPPSAPPWRWLFAGTLDRLKGADQLVRILQHVAGQGRLPVEFWVAGEGPYAEVLSRIPGVRYLGRLSWSRMQEVYPRVHGVLVLNRYANLTLPLVEGLAHGRPVLGMETSGESRVLGREEGVIWVRSLDALVQQLYALGREETYRSLQASTSRGARRFPTWEEVANREMDWIHAQLEENG